MRQSALIDAPRGILKVLAWNKERHTPPSRYGTKVTLPPRLARETASKPDETALSCPHEHFFSSLVFDTVATALCQPGSVLNRWSGVRCKRRSQLAFSYVRGVELLPYPTSWPNDRQQRAALHVDRPPAPTYNAQGELPEEDPFVYRMGETISMGPEPRMRSLLRCVPACLFQLAPSSCPSLSACSCARASHR